MMINEYTFSKMFKAIDDRLDTANKFKEQCGLYRYIISKDNKFNCIMLSQKLEEIYFNAKTNRSIGKTFLGWEIYE